MVTLDLVDKRLKHIFDQLLSSFLRGSVSAPMPPGPIPAVLDVNPVQLRENLIRDLIDIHGGQHASRFGKDRLGNGPLAGSQALQHVKGLFPGQFGQQVLHGALPTLKVVIYHTELSSSVHVCAMAATVNMRQARCAGFSALAWRARVISSFACVKV
jgi:hypothetical protein